MRIGRADPRLPPPRDYHHNNVHPVGERGQHGQEGSVTFVSSLQLEAADRKHGQM